MHSMQDKDSTSTLPQSRDITLSLVLHRGPVSCTVQGPCCTTRSFLNNTAHNHTSAQCPPLLSDFMTYTNAASCHNIPWCTAIGPHAYNNQTFHLFSANSHSHPKLSTSIATHMHASRSFLTKALGCPQRESEDRSMCAVRSVGDAFQLVATAAASMSAPAAPASQHLQHLAHQPGHPQLAWYL